MATEVKTKPGRKPKPAALKRDDWIRIRVNPLELAAARARAQAAGFANLSDYGRFQVCGAAPEQTAAQVKKGSLQRAAEKKAPGDRVAIEQRIRREQPGLPLRSVRTLAARELARA